MFTNENTTVSAHNMVSAKPHLRTLTTQTNLTARGQQKLQRENSSESAVIMKAQHVRSVPSARLTVVRKMTIVQAQGYLVSVTNVSEYATQGINQ